MLNEKKYIILIITLLVLSRIFILDYYKIPSTSMLPTMEPGDYIVITKSYFFSDNSHLGHLSSKIKKGSIYVFYKPDINRIKPKLEYVKRCYGLPGDKIFIQRNDLKEGYPNRVKNDFNIMLFPHDSSYKWTINKYGPLLVPRKGMTISINYKNLVLYKEALMLEGKSTDSIKSKLDNNIEERYTFKNNYYFMVGDNFYESEDSRFFGFVPEHNIIGRVILVI